MGSLNFIRKRKLGSQHWSGLWIMVMERAGRVAECPQRHSLLASGQNHPLLCRLHTLQMFGIPGSQLTNARSTTRWTWQPRTPISKSPWKEWAMFLVRTIWETLSSDRGLVQGATEPRRPMTAHMWWSVCFCFCVALGPSPRGRLTYLCSSGSSHPSWHSQWQSRKVSTWPFAAEAPSSRARTRPSLLLARIRRTLGSFDSSFSRRSFRCSGEASGTMRDTHPKPGPSRATLSPKEN